MIEQPFPFFSSERALAGTLARPAQGLAPAVVLCHGFGSHDDDIGAFTRLARALASAGIASLRFSFSGSDPYPHKGAICPASEWVFDALAAAAALRRAEGIDPSHLGLLVMSVGGGVVIQAAALTEHVKCVGALAPVADGKAWLQHRWRSSRDEAAWQAFSERVLRDQERVACGEPGSGYCPPVRCGSSMGRLTNRFRSSRLGHSTAGRERSRTYSSCGGPSLRLGHPAGVRNSGFVPRMVGGPFITRLLSSVLPKGAIRCPNPSRKRRRLRLAV